jgi:hypothetical protein
MTNTTPDPNKRWCYTFSYEQRIELPTKDAATVARLATELRDHIQSIIAEHPDVQTASSPVIEVHRPDFQLLDGNVEPINALIGPRYR